MFEGLDELAARLLAADPAQDNPCEPMLDPDGSLVARAGQVGGAEVAPADAEQMLVYAALCRRAETWQTAPRPDTGQTQVGPA